MDQMRFISVKYTEECEKVEKCKHITTRFGGNLYLEYSLYNDLTQLCNTAL